LATNSLLIHLIAGALWAGELLALVAHAMRSGEHADLLRLSREERDVNGHWPGVSIIDIY
jgi:hypothetical protein